VKWRGGQKKKGEQRHVGGRGEKSLWEGGEWKIFLEKIKKNASRKGGGFINAMGQASRGGRGGKNKGRKIRGN